MEVALEEVMVVFFGYKYGFVVGFSYDGFVERSFFF